MWEWIHMCANCKKNEWIIFFSIPLIFVLQEESCVREVQSTTSDYQQLNTRDSHSLGCIYILQKFRVQGCTYFHVITWNIKLVHSNDFYKITASSILSRRHVIIQSLEVRTFIQSAHSLLIIYRFCNKLFLEDPASW